MAVKFGFRCQDGMRCKSAAHLLDSSTQQRLLSTGAVDCREPSGEPLELMDLHHASCKFAAYHLLHGLLVRWRQRKAVS
jgi:hypothetical protein